MCDCLCCLVLVWQKLNPPVLGQPPNPEHAWCPPAAGAVELRNSIARRFDLELPATLMFDHPSLAALAAYLAGQLAPAAGLQLVPAAASASQLSPAAEAAVPAVVGVSARFPGSISGK